MTDWSSLEAGLKTFGIGAAAVGIATFTKSHETAPLCTLVACWGVPLASGFCLTVGATLADSLCPKHRFDEWLERQFEKAIMPVINLAFYLTLKASIVAIASTAL